MRIAPGYLLAILVAAAPAMTADLWCSPGDPGVVTNNDCGFISAVRGTPMLRRSFQIAEDPGHELFVADRIHSGDELIVPAGASLEWTSGNNIIVVLAPGTRVKLGGLRSFTAPDSTYVSRLDITLLEGTLRTQVRLNQEKPEAILVTAGEAEVMVSRGDMELSSGGGWRAAVLAGGASARVRKGSIIGAPFAIEVGNAAGSGGEESFSGEERIQAAYRLPFSFERTRAALPPIPALSDEIAGP